MSKTTPHLQSDDIPDWQNFTFANEDEWEEFFEAVESGNEERATQLVDAAYARLQGEK